MITVGYVLHWCHRCHNTHSYAMRTPDRQGARHTVDALAGFVRRVDLLGKMGLL